MSAYKKFKKLGYKRKQNNKDCIKYLLVDENYLDWTGSHDKYSKIEKHITFNKKSKAVELKEICYTFNAVSQKQIYYINSFNVNEELLDAINEQFLEIKNEEFV